LFNLEPVDNKSIATVLYETADLLEIDAADSFRIRSYRNAAQAIENLTEQIKDIIGEPKKVLAIPGIGKGMLLNLQELFSRWPPQACRPNCSKNIIPPCFSC